MYNKLYDVIQNKENNFMLPFYWQHGDHYETIPQEVERIYNSGCRAFCVESRPHRDFVGETWWRDVDLILSEAKKRDMKVWILDDDHFPTGHAAGHIAKYYPDMRRWDIAERHVDVMGPVNKSLLLTQESDTTRLLGLYAFKRTGEDEKCTDAEVLDFSDRIKNGFVEITLPDGLWRVFFIYKTRDYHENKDYVDMLSPESVRVLIDAVYEPHYEHYKEYFGNTLQGFFSDEPQFSNNWFFNHAADPGRYELRMGLPGMAYPWHENVFVKMQETLEYDPRPYIAAVWFDIGEKTSTIRLAYMDAVTRLYRESMPRQLGDWCRAHGVEYIGHIIEDMNTHSRTGYGAGHYFRALDGQHMSGIDIVLHQLMPGMSDYIHSASTLGNNADPEFFDYTLCKLAPSLAHIAKDMKGRAMCEVFGAYGWAESGSDMKWLLDHLLVRGVNHFVPHAFSPTFPDSDCPPHFGADGKDPQYVAFSRLMTYGNKVAHLLYGGQHIADAAILYDAELEWMNEHGEAQLMQVAAKLLYNNNIDFDFLPIDCITGDKECRLHNAESENGLLKVGENRYKVLVIPEAKLLPKNLTDALDRLENEGVKVIYMGQTCSKEELVPTLKGLFTPDIEVCGKKKFLRSCHYVDGANDIYMFVNENITDSVDCEVTLNTLQSTKGVCLDILNDEMYKIEATDKKVHLTLSPNQSCLMVFGDVEGESFGEKKVWNNYTDADLCFAIETAEADNMQDFTLLKDNVKSSELFSITGMDCMPDFSGRIRYTAKFSSDAILKGGNIAIEFAEVGNSAQLYLNGEYLGIRICKPYRFDITDKVKDGENQLTVVVSNTLANKIKDPLSCYMAIPASGITGGVRWVNTK